MLHFVLAKNVDCKSILFTTHEWLPLETLCKVNLMSVSNNLLQTHFFGQSLTVVCRSLLSFSIHRVCTLRNCRRINIIIYLRLMSLMILQRGVLVSSDHYAYLVL